MEELRFQITDEMEDERIDKCMSLLVENLSRSFYPKADQRRKCAGKRYAGKGKLSCQM